MKRRLALFLLLAPVCASSAAECRGPRVDWRSVDRAIAAAAQRADEATARRRQLQLQRMELDAIVLRNRKAFEQGAR